MYFVYQVIILLTILYTICSVWSYILVTLILIDFIAQNFSVLPIKNSFGWPLCPFGIVSSL